MALRSSASLSIRGLRDSFFLGGGADEVVPSFAAGSSAAVQLTVGVGVVLGVSPGRLLPLLPLLGHSVVGFLEESDIEFPPSTSIEVEVGSSWRARALRTTVYGSNTVQVYVQKNYMAQHL